MPDIAYLVAHKSRMERQSSIKQQETATSEHEHLIFPSQPLP